MKSVPWQTRYGAKVCSAAEAVAKIQPGTRILIGSGAAQPCTLVDALVSHGGHLADNQVVHLLTLGPAPYVREGMADRFRHTAFFIGANTREAVAAGRADFMPVFLSELPRLIKSGRLPVHVALIQVSPPCARGYVSLGVSVDVVRAAVDQAALVLAEVNPRMPRTLGDTFVHVDDIDCMIPVDVPVLVHDAPEIDAVSLAIGEHVATLIPDGATLQMGIGKIPDATLRALGDRNDLGVHTEMFSDGVMTLVDQGVITGRRKTLLPGKVVTSFLIGSQALYEWVDDNPVVEMRPSDFTNDPFTIARNANMVAINSALAVDLTGQVAADTVGGRFFSGIGGQVDFIRGAARSPGGRPVIALPSTAKGGTVSRIQARLEQGAGVVTSRGDVHYVVTEHGVADLWGKNIRQRAMALIEIAHPDFRVDLLNEAKARHYVFADQSAPHTEYPWEQVRTCTLRSGETVTVRPVRITDEESLRELFYKLSDDSTYRRFMAYTREHAHDEMEKLTAVDFEQNMAFLVAVKQGEIETTLAMARFDVQPATGLCDVAFVVRDDWQGKGIATLLLERLADVAHERGYRGFSANVAVGNRAMMTVFQKSGLRVRAELHDGVYGLTALFDPPAPNSALST